MPKANPAAELAVTANADAVEFAKVEKLWVAGAAGLTGVDAGVAFAWAGAASGRSGAANGRCAFWSAEPCAACCLASELMAGTSAAGVADEGFSACFIPFPSQLLDIHWHDGLLFLTQCMHLMVHPEYWVSNVWDSFGLFIGKSCWELTSQKATSCQHNPDISFAGFRGPEQEVARVDPLGITLGYVKLNLVSISPRSGSLHIWLATSQQQAAHIASHPFPDLLAESHHESGVVTDQKTPAA